jgi:argininosuccinate lyase
MLKGTPSTFNKDFQEDKERLFDSFDTVNLILQILPGLINTILVNSKKCKEALSFEMLSTDVAYYLVRRKVCFSDFSLKFFKVILISKLDFFLFLMGLMRSASVPFGS